jgi:hypothetical protein
MNLKRYNIGIGVAKLTTSNEWYITMHFMQAKQKQNKRLVYITLNSI